MTTVLGNSDEEKLKKADGQITTWALDYIGKNEKESYSEVKVKVAILDSGIYKEHEDLKDKVVKEYNAINPEEKIIDKYGHGTAIAGIIAASNNDKGIVGVNENVELYDVKVLNDDGKGDINHLIDAIEWCIEQNIDIINISFGLQSDNEDLKRAIYRAYSEGIIIVAASGNTYGLGVDYPAKYDYVYSITALSKDLKRLSSAAKGKIDLAAPGFDILSTDKNGTYQLFNGTSFATAYATGVMSVWIEQIYNLRSDLANTDIQMEIRSIVNANTENLGPKSEYGLGLLKVK